jgi:hypothetical protein
MRRLIAVALVGSALGGWAATPAQATVTIIKPPPEFRWVGRIIKQDFLPMGRTTYRIAMCVANRESGFDPNAYNPQSGASGVYQFIPTSWKYYSEKAGYGGVSPFKARANVGTAAWTVKHVGWGPWGGGC